MKTTKKLTALMAAFIFALALGIAKPQIARADVYTDSYGTWTYDLDSEGNATITGGPISGDITIPSKVNDYPVTAIGDWAFDELIGLKSVTIPNTVTAIGQGAFYGCINLKTVTFEGNSKLTTIGELAFKNCTGLTTVTFGDNSQLTTIGKQAFDNCTSLTSIEIPASVTSIGEFAFKNCTGLTTVTFGDNSKLTTIGVQAFEKCTNLTSIEIPASVTSIGKFAFYSCEKLTSIEIPASVKTIGEGAFDGCTILSISYDGTEEEWNNAKGSNYIGYDGAVIYRDYTALPGQELKYTKGSGKDMELVFIRTTNPGATFDYFDKDATDAVQIDETPLEASNYKAESGSLKLTLNAAYLEGLSESDHSLQVNFKDGGTAYADFTIVGAGGNGGNGGNSQPNNQGGGDAAQTGETTGTTEATAGSNPNTGDSNAMGLFIALTVLSIGGVVVTAKQKKQLSK